MRVHSTNCNYEHILTKRIVCIHKKSILCRFHVYVSFGLSCLQNSKNCLKIIWGPSSDFLDEFNIVASEIRGLRSKVFSQPNKCWVVSNITFIPTWGNDPI